MSTASTERPTSKHFDLHQLAGGVYAAIATPDGAAHSNAGIIDLGDRTLIFDTFDTPMAARDLRAAAEALTGRLVSYVAISHVHSDQWMGNQVYQPQTTIITTHKVREAMSEWGEEMLEHKDDPAEYVDYLQELETRLGTEKDPRWRASLERSIGRTRQQIKALSALEIRYPEQTFAESLDFHGSQRSAKLISRGAGHSESDISLLLPDERIAFIGDLGFFGTQPFLLYCQLEAWNEQLDTFQESDFETFVPGHGALGTKENLALQQRYFIVLEEQVSEVIAVGGSEEDAVKIELPAPFDSWQYREMGRFEANVQFMFERLSGNS